MGQRAVTATSDTPSFSSDPIIRGNNVGVFGRVVNTSSIKTRLTILITATLSTTVYTLGSAVVRLAAGSAVLVSISWAIPAGATAGDYNVKIEVESGNNVIATGSDLLTVSAS